VTTKMTHKTEDEIKNRLWKMMIMIMMMIRIRAMMHILTVQLNV
jgi:hypothetical protein